MKQKFVDYWVLLKVLMWTVLGAKTRATYHKVCTGNKGHNPGTNFLCRKYTLQLLTTRTKLFVETPWALDSNERYMYNWRYKVWRSQIDVLPFFHCSYSRHTKFVPCTCMQFSLFTSHWRSSRSYLSTIAVLLLGRAHVSLITMKLQL